MYVHAVFYVKSDGHIVENVQVHQFTVLLQVVIQQLLVAKLVTSSNVVVLILHLVLIQQSFFYAFLLVLEIGYEFFALDEVLVPAKISLVKNLKQGFLVLLKHGFKRSASFFFAVRRLFQRCKVLFLGERRPDAIWTHLLPVHELPPPPFFKRLLDNLKVVAVLYKNLVKVRLERRLDERVVREVDFEEEVRVLRDFPHEVLVDVGVVADRLGGGFQFRENQLEVALGLLLLRSLDASHGILGAFEVRLQTGHFKVSYRLFVCQVRRDLAFRLGKLRDALF